MYLCILLISACLANVKTKSIVEADHSGNVSQERHFFNESEIPSALIVSDYKCEGLCSENLQKAVPQCKKGQGLVPTKVFEELYCKDCECRNDNNCSFTRSVLGDITKKCQCETGYEEKKGVCIGTCKNNPCQNEGDCVVVGQDIKCNCKGPFNGSRCEQKFGVICKKGQGLVPKYLLDNAYCKDCECRNDNNCTFTRGFLGGIIKKCECEAGYEEKNGVCIGTCKKSPCQNGGGCTIVGQDIKCNCKGQFTGNRCENKLELPNTTSGIPATSTTDFSDTESTVYLPNTVITTYLPDNGKTTDFTDNGKTTDFTDTEMTTELPDTNTTPDLTGIDTAITNSPNTDSTTATIDLCVTKPCKNGGICKMEGENYVCYCLSPFTGKYCEMDPCSNNPCRNGGTCFVNGASFQCICRQPFAGNTCEANPCMWNPCKNGGICKLVNKSARCFCDNSYTGEYCEFVKGTGLTLIMFIVISSLLIIILVVVSCNLCQRIRGSEKSVDREE